MSDRLLCIDSDVFTLLAVAGRLDRVVALLRFPPDATRRLAALEHMLKKGRSFQQFGEAQKQIALEAAKAVLPFEGTPQDAGVRDRLAATTGIDPGEQVLFASLAEQPFLWLTSGDTRAMRALCASPALADIRCAISSRVVSLEAVIYLLIREDGYDSTASAFEALRGHRTLRSFFLTTHHRLQTFWTDHHPISDRFATNSVAASSTVLRVLMQPQASVL